MATIIPQRDEKVACWVLTGSYSASGGTDEEREDRGQVYGAALRQRNGGGNSLDKHLQLLKI
jgi:hypothetical protein